MKNKSQHCFINLTCHFKIATPLSAACINVNFIDGTAVSLWNYFFLPSLLLDAGGNEMVIRFEQNVTLRATFSGNWICSNWTPQTESWESQMLTESASKYRVAIWWVCLWAHMCVRMCSWTLYLLWQWDIEPPHYLVKDKEHEKKIEG